MNYSHTTAARIGKGVAVFALAGALSIVSAGIALADQLNGPASARTVDTNLLTTTGVRAGSAGPDFLGISNQNYDFTKSHSAGLGDPYPYSGYSKDLADADTFNRIAIWSAPLNENANPYYQNILRDYILQSNGSEPLSSAYTKATTYHNNPGTSSWGDSNGTAVTRADGSTTIIGLEYYPDIIFGASKTTNWNSANDYSQNYIYNQDTQSSYYAQTNIARQVALESDYTDYNPTFTNNDSTNIWSQMYSLEQLARTADGITATSSKYTRYDSSSASTSALNYERAIRGQMLYIASKIDSGDIAKKTVAYLYAIDADGTGYFFVPTADNLLVGDDTGETANSAVDTADDNYAANNSTINMGYMATLPFITNTFDSGVAVDGGIVMKVEDIFKTNPACKVTADADTSILADVDVIIYNSTKNTDLNGTSNGKNSSGINNEAALNNENVTSWASAFGFEGDVQAGDDFGTSTQQAGSWSTDDGFAPLLYCQRNYTCDKNARAAWAFSKVYPELYGSADDTYAYWVEQVYHVRAKYVTTVVAALTHQSDLVLYSGADDLEAKAEEGYQWWMSTGAATYDGYAYYNGSSRASYYNAGADATYEEPGDTISIMAPSALWQESTTIAIKNCKATLSATTAAYTGKAITPAVTVKTAGGITLTKGTDYTVTYKSNTAVGKATVTIKGAGIYSGTITKTFTIKPAKAAISTLTVGKKCLTVKAAKTAAKYGATGFQIAYKQTTGSKWVYAKFTSQSKKTTTLYTGKKYQVKVRAYKVVNGTTYYGAWSTVKTSGKIK